MDENENTLNKGPWDVVVVGASGGIGQHLCQQLGHEHRVIGTYCKNKPAAAAAEARYFQLDVTDSAAVTGFAADVAPGLLKPVLVYAAGLSPNAVTHKLTDEDWHRALGINLTGAMHTCRALLPRMRELGWGRIILMSSVLARTAVPGTLAYSAAKAGICSMARVISVENATKGITANALALGYYSVGVIRAVPQKYLDSNVIPSIPQRRLGDPQNIVEAIRFLVAADYTAGATLDINGGIIAG